MKRIFYSHTTTFKNLKPKDIFTESNLQSISFPFEIGYMKVNDNPSGFNALSFRGGDLMKFEGNETVYVYSQE